MVTVEAGLGCWGAATTEPGRALLRGCRWAVGGDLAVRWWGWDGVVTRGCGGQESPPSCGALLVGSGGFSAWGGRGDVGEEGAEGGEGGGVGWAGGEVVDFGGVGGEVEELGSGDEWVVDAFPAAVGDCALEVAVGSGDVLAGGVSVLEEDWGEIKAAVLVEGGERG